MPHQVRHDFGGGGCQITCGMTLWELSTLIKCRLTPLPLSSSGLTRESISVPVFHFGCRIKYGMTLEGGGCQITCGMTLWELSTFIGLARHLPRCHPRASGARPGDPSQYHFSPLAVTYSTQPPFALSLFFILGLDQGGTLKTKNARDYQAFFVVYVLISTSRIPGKPCMFR